SAPSVAAPLWIEKSLIPDPDLIDAGLEVGGQTGVGTVDHAVFAGFLDTYLVGGADGVNRLRYGSVSTDDRNTLGAYVDALEAIVPSTLSEAEQVAFWINLYNAQTILSVLDAYPVDSIRKIGGVWADQIVTVDGIDLSLGDIEHHILRASFGDPRLHYALNCASIGCPNLQSVPFSGVVLEKQLDGAARDYINHPRGVRIDDDGDVIGSKIFGWYKADFGGSRKKVIEHILQFAGPELSEGLAGAKKINDYKYDWTLNDQAISEIANSDTD
ncbi:MAG: DUF547 domain-containing protein, partial [Pseudomonadota bacterium]